MKPENCICYNCNFFRESNGTICGGGCEDVPFYDEEACSICCYKEVCEVPKNPELYKWEEQGDD